MRKLKIATFVTAFDKIEFPRSFEIATNTIAKFTAEGLVKLGHEVDFFAVTGSSGLEVSRVETLNLPPLYENDLLNSIDKQVSLYQVERAKFELWILWEQYMLTEIYKRANQGQYDLIHLHCLERFLPFPKIYNKIPTVYTLHDTLINWKKEIFELYKTPNLYFAPISNSQKKLLPELNYTDVCYNGIDIESFKFSNQPKKDTLVYVGRINKEKGVAIAIKLALKTGKKLLIAGPITGEAEDNYFKTQVQPYLSEQIVYLGSLPRPELHNIYGQAKALLFPISREEPFGLVMVEAMACGTPVIAFDRGSVREVVVDQVTGFVVQNEAQMLEAIDKIGDIDRLKCRKHVENNFTLEKMAKRYERIFHTILDKHT